MSIKKELQRYSKLNGYEISVYDQIICTCKNNKFKLYSDDTESAAYVTCSSCGKQHSIENSAQYIENPQQNVCACNNPNLYIGAGKALYDKSKDTRWVYIGAECSKCGLTGVYVDWNER